MSVRVMSWVWDHSRAEGTDRLVLLAIADCASDDGGNAWPSVATLAAKTKVSGRTVQRAIRALTVLGEVRVDENAGRKGTNVYTITMGRHSDTCQDVTPPDEMTGRQDDTVTPMTPRGDVGVTRTIKNHPLPPNPPHAGGTKLDHCDKHSKFRRGCVKCAEARAAARAKPPWCGHCNEQTRIVERDAGEVVGRCSNCHPIEVARRTA